MKYIRTKDGRALRLIEKCEYEENIFTYIVGWDWEDNFEINQEDVIKIADTIEELCDWLVFRLNGKIKVLYEDLDTALQVEGNDILIYKEIYGALDTDKGLIYVAKMNDKGELELL